MSFQNDKYLLRPADSSDNDGIRAIFESESFRGNLDVKFLRNPAPYESFAADGEMAKVIVAVERATNRIVAVGGAVIRREFVHGRKERCAYLTGLKVHPEYRRKFIYLKQAYAELYEHIKDCPFKYTTVLDSNVDAIRMFEKKRKNMPTYTYLGHYTTYCFHGGCRKIQIEKDHMDGFQELLDRHFSKQSLVPCDYEYKGFGKKHFYCVRKDNEIVACCFVGDQQETKQYKMCSYGGMLKMVSHFPTKLFGYPVFPKPDSVINHGVISYLYVKENDKKLCQDFLQSVAAESPFSLLLWGGFENNPLSSVLDEMKTIKYGSRLYSVDWEGETEIQGVIGMEAAVL
nr:GNAT family N-acetyltransferase [Eubacterium sp.]